MPFSTAGSFLIFRIFIAFFLTIFGLALAFQGSILPGAVIAAIGLTFLTMMWLIVRGSAVH
jgi:hypothetical protein